MKAQLRTQPQPPQPHTFVPAHRPLLQRKCACGGAPGPTGECEACRKKKLQPRVENLPGSFIFDDPLSSISEGLRSPDQQLDQDTRGFMEPRFGHDFSQVRVHTDSAAASSARTLGAQAYTIGRDVFFGAGQYSPATTAGQRLLAHELAHVIQQDSGGPSPPSPAPLSATELEADRASQSFVTEHGSIEVALRNRVGIARTPASKDLNKVSDRDLEAERKRTVEWLATHSVVYADYLPTKEYLEAIQREIWRRKSPLGSISESMAGALVPSIYDANVRIKNYVKPAEELAKKIFADYESGKISHMEGRITAHQNRNELLNQTRAKLSPSGKTFSRIVKSEGTKLPELVRKYSHKVLEADPQLMKTFGLQTLDPKSPLFNAAKYETALVKVGATASVSERIIKAAGKSGASVTGMARVLKYGGPIGTGIGVAISSYEVITAPEGDKIHTLGREASGFAGGMLGSAAGGLIAGWTASLACGPAAPICGLVVTIAIIGGSASLGGALAEEAYESLSPRTDLLEKPERSLAPAVSTGVAPKWRMFSQ